jgi:CBS domain containing-hemolysin-like protein/mannitol/fructose-specific phosphotransferase system IIA component (Ntr-type)
MLSVLPACLLLIALNAFFVLMEFALVKVRSSRIEMLARRGNSRAILVQDILGRLDEYLAAIQMGITVIALALGWIGEPLLASWLEGVLRDGGLPANPALIHGLAVALGLAVLSWAHIVFGELIPRAISIQKAEIVALWGAIPLRWFALVLRLPIQFMSRCSLYFLRLMGMKPAADSESIVSEDEMRILLGETHEKGNFPLERLFLLENLFDLGAAKAAEAMVPREKVAYLSLRKSWPENLEIIQSRRFSRYPVCEDDLDTLSGFVHVKDLILRPDMASTPDLKRLRRDIHEIVEDEPLEKLLKSFPDRGIHMAAVRNALGKVTGILTFEDIIEELVGEVHDEFDLQRAWSLADLIVPSAVAVQMQAPEKRTAIAMLLGKLKAAHHEIDEPETLRLIWERELKFSSGVGRGVAVPHARLLSLEQPLIALGRFSRPVPFASPDNVPVRLIFLILTPAATPVIQLKILGRIAALVTNENFRRKLLRAKTAEAVLELLHTGDTVLA